MTISVKHPAVSGRKITPADYASEHLLTGTPGKWVKFGSGGALEEVNAPSGGGSSDWISLSEHLDPARVPFVTDDLPAFEAALAAVAAAGATILTIPAGRYFIDGALNIHTTVHIIGAGSTQQAGTGSLIRFGKNSNGIVVNKGNTHDNTTGTQGDASGTIIEGLQLWGGGITVNGSGVVTNYAAGDSTTGHGVRIRGTFVALKDVMTAFFGGNGFDINCSAGSGGATEGNANSFYLERCFSIYNRGYAYLVNGVDANAGTMNTCSAISCSGGGFIDYSFLGNTYIQPHVRDCGVNCAIGSTDDPTGTCTYSGASYRIMPGQETAASTTTPGADATVWVVTSAYANRPWVAGKTWAVGAPFSTQPGNTNARNVVIGLYTEDNMMPVYAESNSLVIGGLSDNSGFIGDGGRLYGIRGGLQTGSFTAYDAASGKYSLVGNATGLASNGAATVVAHHDGTSFWSLFSDGGLLQLNRAGGPVYKFTSTGPDLPSGKVIKNNGTQVLGAQGAAVADATGGATIDTEARAAINALLARCRAHGLIGT